jgi:hypothetical protein
MKQTIQICRPDEVALPQVPHRLPSSHNCRNWGIAVDRTSGSPNISGLALVACGLWLHVGLIGAIALAVGLLQWFGDPRLPWSPVVAFFGAAVALASWRRGFAVLEQAERASAHPADGSGDSRLRNAI